MENIYLVGMRGVGKTTIGKLLAEKLKREFVDMDKKIEQDLGKTVSEIVELEGWEHFRQCEQQVLENLLKATSTIVSTGGGTLMHFDNAERMKSSGKLILLTAELRSIQARLENSEARPSLTGRDPFEELEQVWNERKDRYYHFADQVVNTEGKTPDDIVQEIIHE